MNTAIHGGLALLALAFLMPGHYLPWVSFQSQFIAALGAVVIGAAAALQARQAGRSVPWPGLARLALATAAIPWLQFAAGQVLFMSDALVPSLYLGGLAFTIAAGAVWSDDDRARMVVALLAWLLAASAISVAIALIQWLQLGWSVVWMAELPPGARPYANLAQPNHLATLLGLGLVAVVVLFERGSVGPFTAWLLTVWVGFGLVMTQSRTGWLAVAVLAIACVAPVVKGRPRRLRPRHVVVALALFAGAIVAWTPLNDVLQIGAVNSLAERLQPGPRGLIWQVLLDAAAKAPWAGYGWNQVNLAQQATVADGAAIGRMMDSSHNIVLDLALWAGVPLALVWSGWTAAGLLRRREDVGNVAGWGAVLGIVVILIHALLEYPLLYSYFLLPVGLLWGLTSRPASTLGSSPAWAYAAGIAVLAAATAKVATEYVPVEQANRAARFAAAGIGIDRAPTVVIPDAPWLDAPREYVRLMQTPARPQMPATELDWMREVVTRHAFPPALLRFALAAGLNSRPDEAALALRRLCSMHGPRRCGEAITAWTDAQAMHPVLRGIPPPAQP